MNFKKIFFAQNLANVIRIDFENDTLDIFQKINIWILLFHKSARSGSGSFFFNAQNIKFGVPNLFPKSILITFAKFCAKNIFVIFISEEFDFSLNVFIKGFILLLRRNLQFGPGPPSHSKP